MDIVNNLCLYIHTGFYHKQHTMDVFLDMSVALDNIQSNILVNIPAGVGVPIDTLCFIGNWCYSRITTSVSFEGKRVLYKGLPQGRVLSLLLYNLYVSKICRNKIYQRKYKSLNLRTT